MDLVRLGLVPAYRAITEALADAAREAALGVNGLRLPRRAERRLICSMAAIAPGDAPVLRCLRRPPRASMAPRPT
jgi:hypothetical protein